MKRFIRNTHTLLIYIFLFLLIILLSSCGSDDPGISDRDALIEALTGTWEVDKDSYIQINDQDITDLLIGFEITIDEELNFTSNGDEVIIEEFPWPASGSFMLNDELTTFTRDDGLVITLTLSDDETLLDLEFTLEDGNGRTTGSKGGWKCGLNKK